MMLGVVPVIITSLSPLRAVGARAVNHRKSFFRTMRVSLSLSLFIFLKRRVDF